MFWVSCRHVTGFVPRVCRWYQATKSTNQAMAAKVDSLKDEMEEALNKVEICKVGAAPSQQVLIGTEAGAGVDPDL